MQVAAAAAAGSPFKKVTDMIRGLVTRLQNEAVEKRRSQFRSLSKTGTKWYEKGFCDIFGRTCFCSHQVEEAEANGWCKKELAVNKKTRENKEREVYYLESASNCVHNCKKAAEKLPKNPGLGKKQGQITVPPGWT